MLGLITRLALGLVGKIIAAIVLRRYHHRRMLRRNHIFLDRTNPFDVFDDQEILKKFRYHLQEFLVVTESIDGDIELLNRSAELSLHFAPCGSNCVLM